MSQIIEPRHAWVVFADHTDLWWLRFLKRGFRHCFLLLHDGEHWLVLDALAPYLEIGVLPLEKDLALGAWLNAQGYKVLPATIARQTLKPQALGLYSCVAIVKKFLGLRARHIITPWQLYKFLRVSSTSNL